MKNISFQNAIAAFDRQDYATARELLYPMANQNHAEAQCLLGNLYQLGLGVTCDAAVALQWYTKASEQGNGLATSNLAGIILTGYQNVAPNPTAAEQLYLKARS
jgi:uncharacterized protein